MKYVVKMVVITMGILLVGCGKVGPDGKIYLGYYGYGTVSLDVTGAETLCVMTICALDETVSIDGVETEGFMLSSGSIDYSYTYDTYEDVDEDGVNDIATKEVSFTVTPNKGGDASGFDDGTAGLDKACMVTIMCMAAVCTDILTCADAGGYSETCTIVDGAQICAAD